MGQLGLAVLEAARVLAAEGARNELEKLVAKGKDLKAAGIAVRALGAYGFSKKRIKVLDFLVAQLRRIQPGTNRARIDRTDRERYDTLSPHFIAALNQLTGRTYRSTEVWLDRYDQAKRDLDALFTRRLVR